MSERIVAMALHPPGPAAPAIGDGDSAPGSQQPRPKQVASSHLGSAAAKGETEGETEGASLSATMATNEGGNRDARPHASMQTASNPGWSVVHGLTRDAANVMAVKRDAEDTQQRSKSGGEEVEPTPRLRPPDSRPAHARAVVSLDGSRCTVIIHTGADVSLVSARTLPSICRGLNVTDALPGLRSRESRSPFYFPFCTVSRYQRLES